MHGFATVFPHKNNFFDGVPLVDMQKRREKYVPERKTLRDKEVYLISSLSAAASSQAPWKSSMRPASVRAARAGSMGISASSGTL